MSPPFPRADYGLGAAIIGTGSDEAIHGLVDMMSADQPISASRWAVQIHPTVSADPYGPARHEGTHSMSTREQRGYQMFPVLDVALVETALRLASGPDLPR
jgi:hypothetical protein